MSHGEDLAGYRQEPSWYG